MTDAYRSSAHRSAPPAMKSRRRACIVGAVVLLGPSLIFLSAFTYWPVFRVFNESFLVGRFAGESTFGFGNYLRLFADPHFSRAAWNNLVYAAGTIIPLRIGIKAFQRMEF